MKNSILLSGLGIALILFSCSTGETKQLSNEDIAKAAIKEYLFANLNDTSSYEPVEFGSLDSVLTLPKEILEKVAKYEVEKMFAELEGNEYNNVLDVDTTQKIFSGFKMYHKFRASNALGAKVISEINFYLDENLKVTEKSNTSNNEDEAVKAVEEMFKEIEGK